MIYFDELTNIQDALNAIRLGLDSSSRYARDLPPDASRNCYILFESVRFNFTAAYADLKRTDLNLEHADRVVLRLFDELVELMGNSDFNKIAERLPIIRRVRRRHNQDGSELDSIINIDPRQISIYDFTDRLIRALEGGVKWREQTSQYELPIDRAEDVRRLRQIVPEQKLSPISFAVINGRLNVDQQISSASPDSERIALLAKNDLIKRGDQILSALKTSNCDPRLLSAFSELQEHLRESENIIRLGISNIGCTLLGQKFESELPDALSAIVQAHTTAVGMYVAQFPDWVKFANNAASAQIDSDDNIQMALMLRRIIEKAENNPKLVEPDVPRILRELKATIENPGKVSSRAALASVRSLENFVIAVFRHGADFIEKSASKTVDNLSTATAKTATVALLTLALSTAVDLTPLINKVDGMSWIKGAIEIVQKQITQL